MHLPGTNGRRKDGSNISEVALGFGSAKQAAAIARGALLLTLLAALALLAAQPAQAQTYSLLYNFCSQSGCTDGAYPDAGLIMDKSGNLYGTTTQGGAYGQGTVFELSDTGTETVLHSFPANGTDGSDPCAGLIIDKKGTLRGTTAYGGAYGQGTVFKISATGTETVLHSFTNNGTDGRYPYAGLILGKKGDLYGTTWIGGAYGYGTVFELSTKRTETVLYSFCPQPTQDCPDGNYPEAGLIMDKSGNLYGTTTQGGANYYGTVFEISANGTETVLHSFPANGTDGGAPYAGLLMDKKGNLYGTTTWGGAYGGGTVFELSPNGTETILYSFGNGTDGWDLVAGLIMDKKGNLYGTTYNGGSPYNAGTVFELTPSKKGSWTETILHSFVGGWDGAYPYAGLIMDANGNLYGTTTAGGWAGVGVVFKVTP